LSFSVQYEYSNQIVEGIIHLLSHGLVSLMNLIYDNVAYIHYANITNNIRPFLHVSGFWYETPKCVMLFTVYASYQCSQSESLHICLIPNWKAFLDQGW